SGGDDDEADEAVDALVTDVDPADADDAEPVKVKGAPTHPAVAVQTASARATATPQSASATGAAPTQAVVPVNGFGAVTSNVVAPLVDPEVP
ncbi:hypothetical protein C6A85_66575, partial [Mycobacterium sp. ITM-2017-0098]